LNPRYRHHRGGGYGYESEASNAGTSYHNYQPGGGGHYGKARDGGLDNAAFMYREEDGGRHQRHRSGSRDVEEEEEKEYADRYRDTRDTHRDTRNTHRDTRDTRRDTHYRWPSPSLPPTLTKKSNKLKKAKNNNR
jgi:hypothetical protein